MSKCRSKGVRSLAKAYETLAKLSGSRPSGQTRGSGSEPSYMPQAREKVEALERRESSVQEVPEPAEETQQPTPTQATTPASPRDTEHVAVSIQEDVTTPLLQSTSTVASAATISSEVGTKPDMAQHLTDPNEIWVYFSHLVEHPAIAAVDENLYEGDVHDRQLDSITSVELGKAQERGEHRIAQICNFPLKLILTPLSFVGTITSRLASILEMEFGPMHAALQVGDVILEWNDSSLVIPHFSAPEDPLLRADVQHLSEWVNFTADQGSKIRAAAQGLDFGEQIELIYFVTAEKSRLIKNLIDVIVEYNRYNYYNLISRNCQHFVIDALRALRVDKPIQFTGGLGDYFKALKSGRSKLVPSKFSSHAELEDYVKGVCRSKEIDRMPQQDLEYLLSQYFLFHLKSKRKVMDTQNSQALAEWKCEEPECHMQELEKKINMDSLRIHNFRTVSSRGCTTHAH